MIIILFYGILNHCLETPVSGPYNYLVSPVKYLFKQRFPYQKFYEFNKNQFFIF